MILFLMVFVLYCRGEYVLRRAKRIEKLEGKALTSFLN